MIAARPHPTWRTYGVRELRLRAWADAVSEERGSCSVDDPTWRALGRAERALRAAARTAGPVHPTPG